MTVTLSAPSAPQLSRVRTFLFGAFVFVWFSEMVLWGFFAEEWTSGQNMIPPENLQLATAGLLLIAPRGALNFVVPYLSSLLAANDGGLSSLVFSNLFNGTHLLALATAFWIATVYSRSNPTLRQALTVAGTVHAGLLCLLPLRRMILEVGGSCATSSVLVLSVPLLVGWILYATVAARRGQLRFAEERT